MNWFTFVGFVEAPAPWGLQGFRFPAQGRDEFAAASEVARKISLRFPILGGDFSKVKVLDVFQGRPKPTENDSPGFLTPLSEMMEGGE